MKYDIPTVPELESTLNEVRDALSPLERKVEETVEVVGSFLKQRSALDRIPFTEGIATELNMLISDYGAVICLEARVKEFHKELVRINTFIDFHPDYFAPHLPTKSDLSRLFGRRSEYEKRLKKLRESIDLYEAKLKTSR